MNESFEVLKAIVNHLHVKSRDALVIPRLGLRYLYFYILYSVNNKGETMLPLSQPIDIPTIYQV